MGKKLHSVLYPGGYSVFTTKKKVIFYFLLIVVVIFLVFNSLFSMLYSSNIRDIIVRESESGLKKTMEHVNLIIKNMENTSDIIMNNPLIQAKLDPRQQEGPMDYMEYSQIISSLQGIAHTIQGAVSIDLYLDNGEAIITTDYGLLSKPDRQTLEYFRELQHNSENIYLTDQYRKKLNFLSNRNYDLVTFIRPVYAFSTGTREGVLCISLNKYVIRNIIKGSEHSGSMILTETGDRIVSAFSEDDPWREEFIESVKTQVTEEKGVRFQKEGREEYALVFDTSRYTGWKFVSMMPMRLSMAQMSQLRDYILLLFLGMNLTSAVALILLLSGKIYRKLDKLIQCMREVEKGNFDTTIEHDEQDEFGYMYAGFNTMVCRIRTLFNELFQQRLLQKDAELKLLQSKINPHFIYNIFDNMNWLIQLERYEELECLVDSVSTYYRKILNSGRDFITVSDTVEQLKSYVSIQQIRFKNRFDCTFHIEEEVMALEIPNFMLQPLVENAICHGMEPKVEKGRIVITGEQRGNDVVFSVEDDGVGIRKENLESITCLLERAEVETESHFALSNINKRIKLYYGSAYGLKISSEWNAGTCAVVTISKNPAQIRGGSIC